MNALKQYTGLFTSCRELFDRNSAPAINRLRPDALRKLENRRLPERGSDNYEITDLEGILSEDFGLNPNRIPFPADTSHSFHCGVPAISPLPVTVVNDICHAPAAAELPEGVFAGSLKDFCIQYPRAAEAFYGSSADMENPLVALDTLLVQDGVAVYVPDGVAVERPIQIVNILTGAKPLMAVRRILVILGEGAEAKILSCDHTQSPGVKLASLQVTEIFAGKGSVLDWCEMEESSEDTARLSSTYLKQEEGSRVNATGFTLHNGITRNECRARLSGRNASLDLSGMGIEDGRELLDTYTVISHEVPECRSNELFKYVVDDDAKGAFAGLIHVFPGAEKIEAYQSNRNILGSDTARMFSKPQLEIYNDDVKCSHGTATGQLDANQVFYMRTRGIPEEKAHLLLKQAFMADVIDRVRIPALKDRLTMLVEKRFSGYSAACTSCQAQCNANGQ